MTIGYKSPAEIDEAIERIDTHLNASSYSLGLRQENRSVASGAVTTRLDAFGQGA